MRPSDNSWGQEWREQVTRELESSAEKHQQTAIIQERILNRLQQHDEDIKALESRPSGFRSSLSAYGGCASMLVYASFSAFNTLLSVVAILYSIFHK